MTGDATSRDGDGLPPAKLIRGGPTKLRIGLLSCAILVVGWLLAPPRPAAPPPEEKAAPILSAEVEKRETSRPFERAVAAAAEVQARVVAFPGTLATPLDLAAFGSTPAGFGVVVSPGGDVLSHVAAIGRRLDPSVLVGEATVDGRVTAYEAETGLVLVHIGPGPVSGAVALAADSPQPGQLAVSSARWPGGQLVSPVFVVSVGATAYALGGADALTLPGLPVFNTAGELLAVTGERPRVAHAAAAAVARLARRRDAGEGVPSSLGISLQPLTPALAAVVGEHGVLVADVASDGPSTEIQAGDVLVRIASHDALGVEQANRAITALAPGRPCDIVIRRKGREQGVAATPQATLADPVTVIAAPPPAGAPQAKDLFAAADLRTASVPDEAVVLSVDGIDVTSRNAAATVRRRRDPSLVRLQEGSRRYFAVVPRTGAKP